MSVGTLVIELAKIEKARINTRAKMEDNIETLHSYERYIKVNEETLAEQIKNLNVF